MDPLASRADPDLRAVALLEPVVRLLCYGIGLLAVFMAHFFEYFTTVPHPTFWPLLGVGLGCGIVLVVYDGSLRLLSP